MKNKISIIGIICMLLLAGLTVLPAKSSNIEIPSNNLTKDDTEDDWYYLPSYPNYAPNGLPDFSQLQQDDWRNQKGQADCCGAVSLANILWWFDSRHSNQTGTPGDGNDSYPLVVNFCISETPFPGPYSDDHNYNNVNDPETPWCRFKKNGELIEQIAWYTNRQKDSIWRNIMGPLGAIYNTFKLLGGIKRWLKDTGLKDDYSIKPIIRPSFSTIDKYLRNNCGIILGISGPGNGDGLTPFPFKWGHFVAVAGINSS